MRFPQFWAKGTHGNFAAWRSSDESLSAALALANEAARKLAERIAADLPPPRGYGYADRPLREQVLREFKDGTGAISAAITRNSYGCLVLNTARAMFIDVDLPEPEFSVGRWLRNLLGQTREPSPDAAQGRILAQAEAWVHRHPGWGWRVYRTCAGFRLLATHALFDPAVVVSDPLFDEFEADPLYRRLCKSQECFRARLTPKPWRCRMSAPPTRWPWLDAEAETTFQSWEGRYLKACEGWATCELLAIPGHQEIHPEIQPIVRAHDEATRAVSKLPLA